MLRSPSDWTNEPVRVSHTCTALLKLLPVAMRPFGRISMLVIRWPQENSPVDLYSVIVQVPCSEQATGRIMGSTLVAEGAPGTHNVATPWDSVLAEEGLWRRADGASGPPVSSEVVACLFLLSDVSGAFVSLRGIEE